MHSVVDFVISDSMVKESNCSWWVLY